MKLNPQIFREYDIRGIVGRDLDVEISEKIGRAFATAVVRQTPGGDLTIAIGCDNRPSSPELKEGVIRGMRAAGVNVIDVGTVPTPVLYYAAEVLAADAGLQITGSHNPPEYNGYKLVVKGRALYGEAIQRLHQMIEKNDYESGAGARENRAIIPAYIADVGDRFNVAQPVKVVVDCGNGAGSLVAVDLLRATGAEVIPLFCESDGTFPNHHPDPTVDENLRDLIAAVHEHGANFGIGFDGDADRLGVVDENGAVVRGDLLLLLFGLDVLERLGPGQKLVFDVKCSQVLPEVFSKHGGVPIMWKTGHSLIKEKMKEVNAPVSGELSGHICFGEDYYGFDDALYGACKLIGMVSRYQRPLSRVVADFPQYVSTAEIRVDVAEERKFEIVRQAVEEFSRSHEVIDVDGARVLFDGGWGLLRASNTQPVLVLRFEARTEAQLETIRATMDAWLASKGVQLSNTATH
jgi:phosphomannomutase/phosphoglucomutase